MERTAGRVNVMLYNEVLRYLGDAWPQIFFEVFHRFFSGAKAIHLLVSTRLATVVL